LEINLPGILTLSLKPNVGPFDGFPNKVLVNCNMLSANSKSPFVIEFFIFIEQVFIGC